MDEAKRLATLYELDILAGPREPALDQIARLARLEFETKHAGITMLDTATAHFVARANIAVKSIPRKEAFCNIVIQRDTPLIIPDTWQDPAYSNNPQVALGIRSYVGIPLRTRSGYNVGSLCVLGTEPLEVTPKKIKTLQGLAKLAMQCIELRRLAIRDHLTGSLNRRGFMTGLDRHLLHHAVHHADFSLALMDLDHFKQINDRFGHPVGDLALQAVAALCEAACEEGDLVGRLGGEEFGIIFPA